MIYVTYRMETPCGTADYPFAEKKGERHGVVVRGAGGLGSKAGGGAIRIGAHVPWGAEAECAYRAGYDGRGRVSVTHLVGEGLFRHVDAAGGWWLLSRKQPQPGDDSPHGL